MVIADSVIILDGPVYSPRSGINKAWIKTAAGKKRLTVPVMKPEGSDSQISAIRIDPTNNWHRTHPASLVSNYRNAPYFEHYYPYFRDLYSKPWERFVDLCQTGIRLINRLLRWPDKFNYSSELEMTGSRESRVSQALERFKCDTYVMEEGGRAYFNHQKLLDQGWRVELIQEWKCNYDQQFGEFVPDLSILDLLMNEGPYAVRILQDSAMPGLGGGRC